MYACRMWITERKRPNHVSPGVENLEWMLPRLMGVLEETLYPVTHDTDSQSATVFYTKLVIRKMITQR
jgi:hypothetical protein